MWLLVLVIIINYSDFPSRIRAAGAVVAVCLFVVCFFPFMFLQVLLTIPCMAAVFFLFSPQMQELVTWFLAIGVCLFKFSRFLSLHSLSFFNISFQKKKKWGYVDRSYYVALALLLFHTGGSTVSCSTQQRGLPTFLFLVGSRHGLFVLHHFQRKTACMSNKEDKRGLPIGDRWHCLLIGN